MDEKNILISGCDDASRRSPNKYFAITLTVLFMILISMAVIMYSLLVIKQQIDDVRQMNYIVIKSLIKSELRFLEYSPEGQPTFLEVTPPPE